jgi:hypothetical protein
MFDLPIRMAPAERSLCRTKAFTAGTEYFNAAEPPDVAMPSVS